MKLTPEHIRHLIKEELSQLFESAKQYYIVVPDDGSAILYNDQNKKVSNLYNAMDWVRDPEKINGTARDDFLHASALNQFYEKTHPQEKRSRKSMSGQESNITFNSKEWWERAYGYFKEGEILPEEEGRFSGHPNISPAMMKSLAGVFSQFDRKIPLESISYLAPASPAGSAAATGASFKPIIPDPEELKEKPPKRKWSSPFARSKPTPAGDGSSTVPAGPAAPSTAKPTKGQTKQDRLAAILAGSGGAF